MPDIAGQTLEHASREGGWYGVLTVIILAFMAWYIHSSRKYHAAKEREEARDRESRDKILAEERREWREAIERNTAAFHGLEKALHTKPCLRPTAARTRETDVT